MGIVNVRKFFMKNLKKFPEQLERVETGPIQFGKDWPGMFLRGDTCMIYAQAIDAILEHNNLCVIDQKTLLNLKETLTKCIKKGKQ